VPTVSTVTVLTRAVIEGTPGCGYGARMDPNPNSKSKALIPSFAIAIVVGSLVAAKPWLVQHLGISLLSVNSRLVMALAAVVVSAICVVIVKALNQPKPPA
jgi:hypothetical protein